MNVTLHVVHPCAVPGTPGDKAVLESAARGSTREGERVFVGYRQAQAAGRATDFHVLGIDLSLIHI